MTVGSKLEETVREALLQYDDLTARLLHARGITTAKEAEIFLDPSYDTQIGDPMNILNMRRAATRIAEAINTNERIAVWSDYDCDGIPGGVILHDFLKKAGANFTNYIPHRHEEGFGLNEQGIEKLAKDGATLLITVDCGIADKEAVAYATSLGIEVIVTDHHLPPPSGIPDAYAVVDPKQEGETNEFRDFCGGGLAWKLVCAVLSVGFTGREKIPQGWEKWLLDMAGLATIADMVPLVGENRVIARYGLLVMRKTPRLGFQKLCRVARVNQRSITEDDVGFMIAPRVNAASRMGDPRTAFQLFTTSDEVEADALAKELERINRSRRAAAGAITKAVHERLAERALLGEVPPVIVMGDPEWRPGLLGLVANSVAEEYERPVFLWGREGSENLKGSCRAGRKGVNLVELMEGAKEVFVEFGGHAASGGFSLLSEQAHLLEERLAASLATLRVAELEERAELLADAHLSPAEATERLLRSLERFAPFGMGNPKPLLRFSDVTLTQVAWFGKAGEHLRLTIARDEFGFDRGIEAIAFFARRDLGKTCDHIETQSKVTIYGNLERDQFTRGTKVRLRLVAVHP